MVEHGYNGERPFGQTSKFAYLLHTTKCTRDPIKWEMSLLNAYASGNKRLLSICNFKLSLPIFSNVLSITALNGRSRWNKEHVGRNTMLFRDMRSPSLNNVFPRMHKIKNDTHSLNNVFPRMYKIKNDTIRFFQEKKRKVRVLRYGTES